MAPSLLLFVPFYLVRFLIRMLNFCKVIRFYYKAGILFIFDCQILKSFVFFIITELDGQEL